MRDKYPKTWILVADGARAHVAKTGDAGEKPDFALGHSFANGSRSHTRDIVSDRQGRSAGGAGGERHAFDARTDAQEHLKHEFAREVAEALNRAAESREFERLILVAPAKVLGDLRARLGKPAKAMLAAELDKDLTHMALPELRKRLEAADLL